MKNEIKRASEKSLNWDAVQSETRTFCCLVISYNKRKTHHDDSDKESTWQRVVCQAEQITTADPDKCTVGLFLAQMEAHRFSLRQQRY